MSRRSMYLTWLSIILITGLIYSVIVYQLSIELHKKTSDIKIASINSLRNEVNSSIMLHEQLSLYIFNEKINQPQVLKPMSAASNTLDRQQQSQLRYQLYDFLHDDYASISHYGFKQMHFHFKDGISFLRMQRPELFGDQLFEIRVIVKQANMEQKSVSGFEVGRVNSGYRFVYPLFYRNDHIGTVEMGVLPETILIMLNDTFPDEFHEFIVKKDIVDRVTHDSAKSNYMISLLNDAFYYDQNAYLANTRYWDKSESELIHELIYKIKKDPLLVENLQEMNDFAVEEEVDHVNYLISFATINNYQGDPTAYFISYSANQQLPAVRSAYSLNILLLTLLYLIFAVVSWYFIKSRLKLEMQANIDPLTLIFNRYKFLEMASMEIEKFRRYGRPLSIILFDLDLFKKVNDNHGHATGDYVLKTVAQIINQNKRSADLFARWGGEEFILLLPETSLQEALAVAERLRKALFDYNFDKCHQVTASFGVAELETSDENLDAIIEKVDQALYKAKNSGRNRVEKYQVDEPYLFDF